MSIISDTPASSLARSFGARGGQLRVSLTPRCQINCWFCHNEGETPPRLTRGTGTAVPVRRSKLDAHQILTAIEAMVEAGIRRVFFTGGEPLISLLARPVLERLPVTATSYSTTLITNGLRLPVDLPWLVSTRLGRIKVSLHYFSEESYTAIAGTRHTGGLTRIKRGIEAAVDAFGPGRVEINTLVQSGNRHEIDAIVDYALDLGIGMQVIELVETAHNGNLGGARVAASSVTDRLRGLASGEHVDATGTGQSKRVFTVGRSRIEVIDATLGRYHVGQCSSCPVKDRCVEGFWALRLDESGTLRPCLLREDLRLDVRPHLHDPRALTAAVARHIDAFTEGAL